MTLMTSAALMYRPERVTFFCIGASLYPIEDLPHVVRVNPRHLERDGAAEVLGGVRADDPHAGDLP